MDISNLTKKEQRKFFINKRDNIKDRKLKSEQICKKFIESNIYTNVNTIMVYVSFRSEVETISLIQKLIDDKGFVIVPSCDVLTKTLYPYRISDMSQLASGAYGILEPSEILIEKGIITKCDKADIEAVITPAAAFDEDGFRLGYGAGYYDRFFSDYYGLKIGFQFSECICDKLITEVNDIPVDILYRN